MYCGHLVGQANDDQVDGNRKNIRMPVCGGGGQPDEGLVHREGIFQHFLRGSGVTRVIGERFEHPARWVGPQVRIGCEEGGQHDDD